MRSRTFAALVVGVAGALIAVPAAAADPAPAQSGGYDPNERVCEKITVVGSRLAVKTVCMTRAQWDDRRREDRDAVERAQRAANAPCSTINRSGTPTCD